MPDSHFAPTAGLVRQHCDVEMHLVPHCTCPEGQPVGQQRQEGATHVPSWAHTYKLKLRCTTLQSTQLRDKASQCTCFAAINRPCPQACGSPQAPPSAGQVSGELHFAPTAGLVRQHDDAAMHLDPHCTCPEGQPVGQQRQQGTRHVASWAHTCKLKADQAPHGPHR